MPLVRCTCAFVWMTKRSIKTKNRFTCISNNTSQLIVVLSMEWNLPSVMLFNLGELCSGMTVEEITHFKLAEYIMLAICKKKIYYYCNSYCHILWIHIESIFLLIFPFFLINHIFIVQCVALNRGAIEGERGSWSLTRVIHWFFLSNYVRKVTSFLCLLQG